LKRAPPGLECSRSPLRFGPRKTEVPWTSCAVSRSKVPRVLTKRIEKSVLFFRAGKWLKIKGCRHFEESNTNLLFFSNSLFIWGILVGLGKPIFFH